MPQENKKRGRRGEEKKRKLDDEAGPAQDDIALKRPRILSNDDNVDATEAENGYDAYSAAAPRNHDGEIEFYGMLDSDEQEYFKHADDMLELNQFDDSAERLLFLASLHKEAAGKELKLACSQSCSRLLERLILLSNAEQLKSIFGKFNGHFLNLVQHRFASHCCETLFTQCASVVNQEVLDPTRQDDHAEIVVSMENLFLYAVNELTENLGYLLTDRFASHTIRTLLFVLSGLPLEDSARPSVRRSRRKERIEVRGEKSNEMIQDKRVVPASFNEALEKVITASVTSLDTNLLRALATHPTGNPTLQLLLRIELTHFGKQRAKDQASILHKLLPDDTIVDGSESASFINSLIYDTVGSRLLEAIIEYSPAKTFRNLYQQYFKERLGSLARNEVAGYVICKVLERLGKDELAKALYVIVSLVPNLAERGRTNVLKTVIERCAVRGVASAPIVDAISKAYCNEDGTFAIQRLLQLPSGSQSLKTEPLLPSAGGSEPSQITLTGEQTHASLFAQALIAIPGPASELLLNGLTSLSIQESLYLARSSVYSHVLQQALKAPHVDVIARRKLITKYQSYIAQLAMHPSASHLVDTIWEGTKGMAFLRERVAEELAEAESSLRENGIGRKVWRNWQMDLYKRRPREWIRRTREEAGNDGFLSFPDEQDEDSGEVNKGDVRLTTEQRPSRARRSESGANGVKEAGPAPKGKTAIQLARERFARQGTTKKGGKVAKNDK